MIIIDVDDNEDPINSQEQNVLLLYENSDEYNWGVGFSKSESYRRNHVLLSLNQKIFVRLNGNMRMEAAT